MPRFWRPAICCPGCRVCCPSGATANFEITFADGYTGLIPGRDKSSLGQRIFIDRAILHNDQKVFVGVFYELDILQGIAIDQQQIRECALLHNTKLAGIGIDKPRKCHQLAIVCGGHFERLGRRVPAD